MLTESHAEVWAAICHGLQRRVGDQCFSRWIAPMSVVSETGEEIRLKVASSFRQGWVEKHFREAIDAELLQVTGGKWSVRVVVVEGESRHDGNRHDGNRHDGNRHDGKTTFRDTVKPVPSGSRDDGRDATVIADRQPAATPVAGPLAVRAPAPAIAQPDLAVPLRGTKRSLRGVVVGPSNQLAAAAAELALVSPGGLYNPLFVYGSEGAGKSWLIRCLAAAYRDRYSPTSPGGTPRVIGITADQFTHRYVGDLHGGRIEEFRQRFRSADVLLLDDVHVLATKRKTQVEFLHTLSALLDAGRQVVVTANVAPAKLEGLECGLVTRLTGGLAVELERPDLEVRLGVARAYAERRVRSAAEAARTARLPDDVLQCAAREVRGSAHELLGALNQLDLRAQVDGSVDLDVARVVLAEFLLARRRRVTLESVNETVARHFGLNSVALTSPSRRRYETYARQVAMYFVRRYTSKSLSEIGRYFGRSHTSVRGAVAKIDAILASAGQGAREIDAIAAFLER